jgi:riboflavin synthase
LFTGIIEEIGTLRKISPGRDSLRFWISAKTVLEGLSPEDSVSVNGVCLTVTEVSSGGFSATAVSKTLEQTTLGSLKNGESVNLERALRMGDRLGGHFVQGHVDGTGEVVSIRKQGDAILYGVKIEKDMMRYAILRGAVAVNGVSLTIAGLEEDRFTVSLIPYTSGHTTFQHLKNGSRVNVEMDFFGKYIERLCARRDSGKSKPNWIFEE